MDLKDYQAHETTRIDVDDVAKSTMLEMSRWTMFLAILGFISLGLMIVGGGFIGVALTNMGYTGSPVFVALGALGSFLIYVIVAAIEFYPIYALFKYSTNIKAALRTNNKAQFNTAFRYLKNMFKYVGILAIIILGLYGIIIVSVVIGFAIK